MNVMQIVWTSESEPWNNLKDHPGYDLKKKVVCEENVSQRRFV